MAEVDANSVLRCGLCNKPFDKKSTLKRHVYYCRSRDGGRKPRARSCLSCATRRTRCDNRRPQCSRCMTKAIECLYPVKRSMREEPDIQHSDGWPIDHMSIRSSSEKNSLSLKDRQDASNIASTSLDGALLMPNLESADLEANFLSWDDPDLNFTEFLDAQMSFEPGEESSQLLSSFPRHSTPSTDQVFQVHQDFSPHSLSIPRSPTQNVRSMIPRSRTKTGAPQRIANLILHTLKSYPLMMLRHNNLPPFIHPGMINSNDDNTQIEPLTNCISLVHMISNGKGSRKLFWKNVGTECEYLCAEHMNLKKWELLAALQALSIYILIRLDEGETQHNDLDFLLLETVARIMIQITRIDNLPNEKSASCKYYGFDMNWKDWIYEESRRRISVVYRVMNMLVYFEPAAICTLQKDLIIAPLPAKKQLWEAGNELLWETETRKEPRDQIAFALAANGELVTLSENQLYCGDSVILYKSLDVGIPEKSSAHWEEWCSGMDGFGGLVMLAASWIV